MKLKLKTLTALVALTNASAALAAPAPQQWPHWYVGLSGGVQFLSDSDIKSSPNGELQYDSAGAVFTGSLGYMMPFGDSYTNGLRAEAEFGYHSIGLDTYISGGTPVAVGDTAQVISYMGNLFYDFRNTSRWTPYLGAGAGLATLHLSQSSGLGNTDTSDTTLAYQFLAGVSYSPKLIPLTEWSLGYRYFALNEPELATATGQRKFDNFDAHSIEAGAKFRF